MQGFSWFFIVCGVCYFALLGLEYSKYVQGQNWTRTTATVDKAINGLPITKFEPHRVNEVANFVSWSYIKYEYRVGDGFYEHTEELGPHLTIFDFIVGPMAQRFQNGDTIDIRYNEHDPKQSVFGFEIFRPIETLGGSGLVLIFLGLTIQYLMKFSQSMEVDPHEVKPY